MRKKLLKFSSILSMVGLVLFSGVSNACTDFRIKAKDGSVVIARTLEFAMDLKSDLRTALQGTTVSSSTPEGKPAMSWKIKYGYLYVAGLNIPGVVDGMNEKGLSFEYLYLPGETQYQDIPAGQNNKAVAYFQLGDWILGNFQTVDEVKKALSDIVVFNAKIPGMGDMVFPLHAAVYDPSGKGIVIEFVNGKMNVYDNEVGIMTNAPTYPWHVANLRNYINLSPYNPNPVVVNGMTFNATGQGAGMLGTPGDVSPPSRFVKTALLLATAFPVPDAAAAVNLSQHIMNNVDIPAGLVRAKEANGQDSVETTQWAVFKDLTHRVFYYRTYNDMTIRSISMDKINFTKDGALLKMPMSTTPYIWDVTKDFLNSKVTNPPAPAS